jgi:hypothetical protein
MLAHGNGPCQASCHAQATARAGGSFDDRQRQSARSRGKMDGAGLASFLAGTTERALTGQASRVGHGSQRPGGIGRKKQRGLPPGSGLLGRVRTGASAIRAERAMSPREIRFGEASVAPCEQSGRTGRDAIAAAVASLRKAGLAHRPRRAQRFGKPPRMAA